MKQQKLRFRILTLLLIAMLASASAYGAYSVSTYGSRWVSSSRNTRYRSAKSSVIPGDIIDRNGVVVAATDENGKRVYQSNILSRSAMVHLLGDITYLINFLMRLILAFPKKEKGLLLSA